MSSSDARAHDVQPAVARRFPWLCASVTCVIKCSQQTDVSKGRNLGIKHASSSPPLWTMPCDSFLRPQAPQHEGSLAPLLPWSSPQHLKFQPSFFLEPPCQWLGAPPASLEGPRARATFHPLQGGRGRQTGFVCGTGDRNRPSRDQVTEGLGFLIRQISQTVRAQNEGAL